MENKKSYDSWNKGSGNLVLVLAILDNRVADVGGRQRNTKSTEEHEKISKTFNNGITEGVVLCHVESRLGSSTEAFTGKGNTDISLFGEELQAFFPTCHAASTTF